MATKERIAEAVNDDTWQEFRIGLKGLSTQSKLWKLEEYIKSNCGAAHTGRKTMSEQCDYCVRVDNYLKALCRGGQLGPGLGLQFMLNVDWVVSIRK